MTERDWTRSAPPGWYDSPYSNEIPRRGGGDDFRPAQTSYSASFPKPIPDPKKRDHMTPETMSKFYGDFATPGDAVSIQAQLFGRLADKATPVVEHYRSDFFHDAHWISRYVTGPTEFFYGFRSTGTSIGTDGESITMHNDHTYKVTVTANERNDPANPKWDAWDVTITEV